MSLFLVQTQSTIDETFADEKNSIDQLIVWLAQTQSSHAAKNSILSVLQENIDWQAFCKSADEQRVFSIAYEHIQNEYQSQIDFQALSLLHKHRQQIVQRNLGLTAKLLKLTSLLEKNQIPVLAYKGAAFSKLVYEDATFRQSTDIDLLIRKSDYGKVKELFIANNFYPAWDLTEKLEHAILKHDYEMPFLGGQNKILVEVHWQLAEHFFSFGLDWDQLWQRKIEINIFGKSLATLSLEDTLIVHCAHATKHLWKRLGSIVDVAQLIARQTIDWELIIMLAKKCGGLRMLWLGLWLSKQMLNAQIPPQIWGQIEADKKVVDIGKKLEASYFCSNSQSSDWKEMARMHLALREKFTDKWLYSYRLLIATKLVDSLFMPLGRPR